MNDLAINEHRRKLKVLCFENSHKPYTNRYMQLRTIP